jgi:hypothetical protein
MKKRILILLALLTLAILCCVAGFYAITANAKGNGAPDPTPTASSSPRSPTATAETCKVSTGIEGGTVNLRACPGAACGAVLDIVTEGASLNIVTAGEWMNVTTARGVAGWLNSKYCE